MIEIENLQNKEAIDQLKTLIDDIKICLFCTKLIQEGKTNRWSMAVQEVCNNGHIWFLSKTDSYKNKVINDNKIVQLYFSSPDKDNYVVVNGEAEIITNHAGSEQPLFQLVKTWRKEGINDVDISFIKVKPITAYRWDTWESRMINFLK